MRFKTKIRNIPSNKLKAICDKLDEKRIEYSLSTTDPRLERYEITLSTKYLTEALLIVAEERETK